MIKSTKAIYWGIISLSIVLFVVHIFYNWAVAFWLFENSGGVRKLPNGWAEYGGIAYAWTTPLYIPGCLVLDLGQKLHGLRTATQPYGIIGLLLILCASILSGWSLASVLFSAVFRNKELLGKYYFRIILALAGWAWVYVPLEWAYVYQWTVVY